MRFLDWFNNSGKVYQDIGKKRSLKFKVLNPQGITLTVRGVHEGKGSYSRYSGDAYELAEWHCEGRANLPKRPFMFNAAQKIKHNSDARKKCAAFLKESIDTKIKMSASVKAEKGVWVDWDRYGKKVCDMVRVWLLEGKLGLYQLENETLKRKSRGGYTSSPLYATGELAKCISYVLR